MNTFISLEELLSPQGENKAPKIGLMVEDWDENLSKTIKAVMDSGLNVQLLAIPSMEDSSEHDAIGNGEPTPVPTHDHHEPRVLFYYKGRPEGAIDTIPVLMVQEGKVKVDMQGRVKELAEALGMLNEPEDVIDAVYPI